MEGECYPLVKINPIYLQTFGYYNFLIKKLSPTTFYATSENKIILKQLFDTKIKKEASRFFSTSFYRKLVFYFSMYAPFG